MDSSTVRGSTTTSEPSILLLNDPLLSNDVDEYRSADDFRAYDDKEADCF